MSLSDMLFSRSSKYEKIIRIDFFPSSNWSYAFETEVWILKIEGEEVKRSLFIGDPLSPEYRKYESEHLLEENRIRIESFLSGKHSFVRSFSSKEIISELKGLEAIEWPLFMEGDTIDGENIDIAIYFKEDDGSVSVMRSMFMECSADEKITDFFYSLFETTEGRGEEPVLIEKELMAKTRKYLPGGYIKYL